VSVAVTLLVGGLLIVAWALHPLRKLRRVAERVGAGDYDAALPAEESSDLGAFAVALRSMVNGIRAREDESRGATVALRESEARFRRTLDDMQEGCQIIGFDGDTCT
jgi:HAMP domain-containing protein